MLLFQATKTHSKHENTHTLTQTHTPKHKTVKQ